MVNVVCHSCDEPGPYYHEGKWYCLAHHELLQPPMRPKNKKPEPKLNRAERRALKKGK